LGAFVVPVLAACAQPTALPLATPTPVPAPTVASIPETLPPTPITAAPEDMRPTWLAASRQAQLATLPDFKVFHDFQLSDRFPESGIQFYQHVTDDSAITFKKVHYDHGTGLAVADVDGDGLSDLYFVNQVGANQLWRNLGGGKFESITQRAGVAVPDKIGVAASFADIDNDGDPDLYVTNVRGGNQLFENDGTGQFTDISKSSGLDYFGHSSGALFFDYDRDGLLDLFLSNVGQYSSDTVRTTTSNIDGTGLGTGELEFYDGFEDAFSGHLKPERAEPSRLFRNAGENRFTEVTKSVGLEDASWSGDASVVDGNADGWPDLYLLNMQGNDEYYENQAGKSFINRSREVFPKTPWGSMGIKVFDFDNDGRLDIYVTDMHSDMSQTVDPGPGEKAKADIQFPESFLKTAGASIFGNALYKNEGGGTYTEVSDATGAETYWPWGPSVGDLNADGFQDAFVTAGMGLSGRYGINSLLLNNQGEKFLDSEFLLGVEPRRDGRYAAPAFEVDCSGADSANPGCAGKTGRVQVWGALSSRSSAMLDLDQDGDLDIVTNDFNSEPMVLESNLAQVKPTIRYLPVRLTGSKSNRDGLGAVVRVSAGGKSSVQVNDGKSGYLSQSSLPLYFGLGEATSVDKIEVDWPSGQQQVIDGPIPANKLLDIEEPEG
jgi:hypothetical protein